MVSGKNSYHHGDLRRSLIDEGLAVTRTQGPQGLGLRAVTRRVGVSANAAYRHFANQQALVAAVAGEILEKMAEQMRTFMAAEMPSDPRALARHRLRAVGLGYITFAVSEPGWFETAFFGVERGESEGGGTGERSAADSNAASPNYSDTVPDHSDASGTVPDHHSTAAASVERELVPKRNDALPEHVDMAPPFALLVGALDDMVVAGTLSAARREGAEWSCWSSVHGFAELVVHGPLQRQDSGEVMRLAERVVDDIIAGIV